MCVCDIHTDTSALWGTERLPHRPPSVQCDTHTYLLQNSVCVCVCVCVYTSGYKQDMVVGTRTQDSNVYSHGMVVGTHTQHSGYSQGMVVSTVLTQGHSGYSTHRLWLWLWVLTRKTAVGTRRVWLWVLTGYGCGYSQGMVVGTHRVWLWVLTCVAACRAAASCGARWRPGAPPPQPCAAGTAPCRGRTPPT